MQCQSKFTISNLGYNLGSSNNHSEFDAQIQNQIQINPLMNKSFAYSNSIAHHLHHQIQEPWSMKILKTEQHMLFMDEMDGISAFHRYTIDASNVTLQVPNPK